MKRWILLLVTTGALVLASTLAYGQPTPDPTPPAGKGSRLYSLIGPTPAAAAVTPRPAFIGHGERPAIAVCLASSCTALTLNPECSLDGVTFGPMTREDGSAVTITESDLTTSKCTVFDVSASCRWFQVRNPTVTSCSHRVQFSADQ